MQSKIGESQPYQPKKKEEPRPRVDEKKEAMKNALFSGISANKKDDDSSDDEPKQRKEEPQA